MFTADDLLRRPEQEARQILRQRKRRDRTSCYPCRSRKVKCDRQLPCDTCIKRGYPELCSFNTLTDAAGLLSRQLPRSQSSTTQQPPCPADLGAAEVIEPLQNNINSDQILKGRNPFLGVNSMPSFLQQQESQASATCSCPGKTIEDAILPILGLEKSPSPYPFPTRLEGTLSEPELDPRNLLPARYEVIRLFQCYRRESHPFCPIIPNIEAFEQELCMYVESQTTYHYQCNQSGSDNPQQLHSWIACLFAILASGAQYSDMPRKERGTKAQLYAQYAFQCLRLANFLVQPSLLCVQTLLVLGNVLQNDMKPEAAWLLLGTTARAAQSIGLHKECHSNEPLARGKLWQAVLWQDSLLSLCFDRPPLTNPDTSAKFPDESISYKEAMQYMVNTILEHILNKRNEATPHFPQVLDCVKRIEDVHLKSQQGTPNSQSNIEERCQKYALDLHVSFVIAWLCRPALRNCPDVDSIPQIQQELINKCRYNLINCVKAFISLQSFGIFASRSWTVLHNGLSSLLLLSLLNHGTQEKEVGQLQSDVIGILSKDCKNLDIESSEANPEITLSRPHDRILKVLKKLYKRTSQRIHPEVLQAATSQWQSNSFEKLLDQPPASLEGDPQICDPVWLLSPQNVNHGILSPLDYFDSIIWDNLNGDTSLQAAEVQFPEDWIF